VFILPADMWIIVTLLIAFTLGLALLYLVWHHKKKHRPVSSKKLEPLKERITRQKQWEDVGDTLQPRRKRTFEEIKREILRAQEIED
jgi:cytochrome c-type biogenesis protein CcmH/NrfG